MNSRTTIAAVVLIAVAALLVVPWAADADAADGDQGKDYKSYYFYGDHPIFHYHRVLAPGVSIEWTVNGIHGPMTPTVFENGAYIQIDISDQGDGPVMVRQDISNGEISDYDIVYAYPLHIGNRTYTVTFMDGGSVFDRQYIDHTTVVEVGNNHVLMPADPVKEGYSFGGWFADQAFTERFDPTKPIRGDTFVYAKWTGSGSDPGSGGIKEIIVTKVIHESHVVTFQTKGGLEYRISTPMTGGEIGFTVGVVGGFQLKSGTLSVTSDYGEIEFSDGKYILSGIDRDIIVTIDGDTSVIGTEPVIIEKTYIPWWIIILIAIIAVALVLIIWWRYKKDGDEEEGDLSAAEATDEAMDGSGPEVIGSDGQHPKDE